MSENVRYPYCKVFFDIENQAHFVTHTDESRHGHVVERSIGGGLIDFITLDLSGIGAEVDKLPSLSFEMFKDKAFDLAESLEGKHRYLYFFLIGELNNIFTDTALPDGEKIRLAREVFVNLLPYQERFDFAVNLCLDTDNLPDYTISEKFIGFTTAFPEYGQFIFKSSLAVSPTYKGKLDFDKIRTINKKEADTKELLRLIHTDHEGVSLASYTIIESLHEMLFFEFTEMLKQGLRVKKCRLCNRYFILQSKHETEYCDRIYRGKRTCKQFGAKKVYNERVAADPVLQEYQRIYKRYFARGGMPFENYPDSRFYNISFGKWSKAANELRQRYCNGEITGDALIDSVQG
jgi:hypothetical protein